MADWITATEPGGKPVMINLDLAVKIVRMGERTKVVFAAPGGQGDNYSTYVFELPEQLVRSARRP